MSMAIALLEGDGVVGIVRGQIALQVDREYLLVVKVRQRRTGELVLTLVGRVYDGGLLVELEPSELEKKVRHDNRNT